MKNSCISIMLLLVISVAKTWAQDNDNFGSFAKKEKTLMLHAYGANDMVSYRKHLNQFLAKYDQLNNKEKSRYKYLILQDYYLLACGYAKKGDKQNALDCLEKSENYDYDELSQDHDMDNLRKEPRFIKFLEESKKLRSEYLTTLQNAPKYNFNEKNDLPAFTYQPADDPNLKALKKAYNLDSVAGDGDDLSKIINLMEWVHYLIPHDGSKGNPKIKNAMSLITECRQGNKTLNCRGLGIVLNEVYLAEGFKSRFVTCLPKDTADNDCHVITMVWSTSLKKWVWMDPTFMAYVMNEEGELLSIEEVRDRLIKKKPLILNPDANRNHAVRQIISDYLGYYMSKNLYKLECPLNSQFNYETPEEGKSRTYIQLLPGNTKPSVESVKDKHGVPVYNLYYTNNPKIFWTPPPADVVNKPAEIEKPNADYEQVMALFKNYYNHQQVDSLTSLVSDEWGEHKKSIFTKEYMEEEMKNYGKMVSYKYMARDDGDNNHDVALFKMVFDKSEHVMGISLDKDDKLLTIRFETSSTYINKLLAMQK